MNKSRLFGVLCAVSVVPSVVVSAAHAENIYDDTRYNNQTPAQTVEDYLNGVGEGVIEMFNSGIKTVADFYRDSMDLLHVPDYARWDKFIEYFDSDGLDALVHAQRVKDLVDYANQSTTGLTTGQNVYCFIAKRKLITGSHNGELTYELDTLYFWRDFNHTDYVDFTGVTIGNFFLQPNTFYCTRQFSNGDFDAFYGDAKQFDFGISNETSNYVSTPFTLNFQLGQTYTVYNLDGTTSSLTFPASNSTSHTWSKVSFKILDNNLNSISQDGFYRQMQYYPSAGQYISDGRLTNAQLMFNNASKSDGSMMRPNNYAGSAEGWGTWYLSSGSFLGNSNNSMGVAPRSFTVNNDPSNYDPRKPPASYNVDPLLLTDTQLTPQNVSNYNDYGISYNSTTNQFDLDIDALAAGIAGLISPDFNGNFGLVYDNQPPIGGSDWTDLTNNYNTDSDNTITDISNLIESLLPSTGGGWTPPDYPAVNTSAFIPAQYPTIPVTATFHPNYVKAVGNTLNNGWNLFDSLGLCAILVPVVIMLLVWRLTGR